MKKQVGFVLFFLFFSSSLLAEEIIMYCKAGKYPDNIELKYKSSFIFGKSLKRRINNKWLDFCRKSGQTLDLGEKKAICSFQKGFRTYRTTVFTIDEKYPVDFVYKGYWVIDFSKGIFDTSNSTSQCIGCDESLSRERLMDIDFKCNLLNK